MKFKIGIESIHIIEASTADIAMKKLFSDEVSKQTKNAVIRIEQID